MYTFFLILTLVSGAALGIGLVLVLAGRRRDESEGRAPRDLAPDQVTPDERSSAALRGTTPTTQLAADIGYAQMKQAVRERRWHDALPGLLVFHGTIGLLLFGALALLAGVDNRLVGAAAVAVATYAVGRMWWSLTRN